MKVVIAILLLCLAVGAVAASTLPSRDADAVLPLLKKLPAPPKIAAVEEILGHRDRDIGSGIYVLIFRLSDDSTITLGSLDGKVALWIRRSTAGREAEAIFDATKRPDKAPEPTTGSVTPRAGARVMPTPVV